MRFICKSAFFMGMAVMVAVFMTTAGCSSGDGPDPYPPSLRQVYPNRPELVLEYNALMAIETPAYSIYDYRDVAVIQKLGFRVRPDRAAVYTLSEGDTLPYPRKGLYEKLSEINRDNGFVKSTPYYKSFCHNTFLQSAVIEDIIEVKVKALTDFDYAHPQGSSLTEITNVNYSSLYPFIQAGYDLTADSKGNGPHPSLLALSDDELSYTDAIWLRESNSMFWSHCKATDIPANPLKMTCGMLALTFDNKPMRQALIEVTVTVRMRGNEYPPRTYRQTYNVR